MCASMSGVDNGSQAIFHFSCLAWGCRAERKRFKRLSSPRAAPKPRLMNRERIFNFNSAINSSLTRFAVAAEAPKRLISMCVTEISIYGLSLSRLKTLSEDYLRRRELISLAAE